MKTEDWGAGCGSVELGKRVKSDGWCSGMQDVVVSLVVWVVRVQVLYVELIMLPNSGCLHKEKDYTQYVKIKNTLYYIKCFQAI